MEPSIAVLDIGHGNSAVLRGTVATAIIDTGPKTGLLDYLLNLKVFEIHHVILSHSDADHIGGLVGILMSEQFTIGTVWFNTDSSKDTQLKMDVDWAIHDSSTKFINALTPDAFSTQDLGGIVIEALAPSAFLASRGPGSSDKHGREISPNTISSIIRSTVEDGPSVLFAGDIDDVALKNISEDGVDITADILVFPHHGGKAGKGVEIETFTTELLEKIQPSRIIFSIGREKFQNPLLEVVNAIGTFDPSIWISCTQLSKNCASDEISILGSYIDPKLSKGATYCQCCIGTIHLNFNENKTDPERAEHEKFISDNVPHPICQIRALIAASEEYTALK